MEYNRTYWQAREGTKLNKFQKVNETLTTVELVNAPDAITVAGTEVTTSRLNNMEAGITGAVAGVNEIQGVVDFAGVIYKKTALEQTERSYRSLTKKGTDRYVATTGTGYIYKLTGGTFIQDDAVSRSWSQITTDGVDLYGATGSINIYRKVDGGESFIAKSLGNTHGIYFYDGLFYIGSQRSIITTDNTFGVTTTIFEFSGSTTRKIFVDDDNIYVCRDDGFYVIDKASKEIIGYLDETITSVFWINGKVFAGSFYKIYKKEETGVAFSLITSTIELYQDSIEYNGLVMSCVSGGDIYTYDILTGNTFRASSSFTLPAMPDGARKRILNTHATTAITVTAYSGTTIEGQATMTLSAGHEVELELIGTDWRKTGWNEKSLASFVRPVDCTSRVAEYTGDGIPLIPDNVAGTTFVKDSNWTDLGGWTVSGATASYVNGRLRLTASGGYPQIYQSSYSSFSGKEFRYKVRKISGSATVFKIMSGGVTIKTSAITTGTTIFDTTVLPTLSSNLILLFEIATVGDVYEIETLYIGTGAYDTPALDRAGNGNSLSLNAVTPVNGKYGKEMSFNGSTSYAQASSPVIGTTGTVAVRFKRSGDLGSLQFIYDNRNKTNANGTALYFDASNVLFFSAREDDAITENYNLGTTIDETTNYHTLVIAWNGANIVSYIDNIASTRAQSVLVSGVVNTLVIGKFSFHSEGHLNGIISHFRYDSRIWTADEARAWSLNPISIDSRV